MSKSPHKKNRSTREDTIINNTRHALKEIVRNKHESMLNDTLPSPSLSTMTPFRSPKELNSRFVKPPTQGVRLNSWEPPQRDLREEYARICSERESRREALFRSGFAGRGKVKKAVWTLESHVRC